MDSAPGSLRRVRVALAIGSLGSVLAVILLMPTLLTMLLGTSALLGVPFTLIRNSRRAALIVDFLLLALLVASHFLSYPQRIPAGPWDIVSLVFILSFHELSSIYSDARELELNYVTNDSEEEVPLSQPMVRVALVHRILLVVGILLASAAVSEVYFLTAEGTSASLYSIYGVAAGIMIVIAFLFILLTIASRKPEK